MSLLVTIMLLIRLTFSFLSFLSLLQLVFLIRRHIKYGDRKNPLLRVVFFMTVSLTFFSVSLLCYYSPLVATSDWASSVYNNSDAGRYVCFFLTRLGSLAFICSVLWYAHLSIMLYFLLSGFSVAWLRKHSSKQCCTVWIISCILWTMELMPFFFGENIEILHTCCLSYDPRNGYAFDLAIHYSPVVITLIISILVLIDALRHLKRRKTIMDISIFVGCFPIVMAIPTAHAICESLGFTAPWLEQLHYLILCTIGIFHYMVWVSIARMSTMNFPIEQSLGEELLKNKERVWHSSLIISTLKGESIQKSGLINSYVSVGSSPIHAESHQYSGMQTSFDSSRSGGLTGARSGGWGYGGPK